MLILDPKKRYLMPDVVNDPFMQSIKNCTVINLHQPDEQSVPGDDHQHHLVSEQDLKKISQEKDRVKRLKEAGIA
ncbi:hypothetical protein KGF56_002905 [Candida oxycetoniae]|uniref:Uncharacterized protein n=1 Tax=Candida oxycetoniae TaxID=497107 RepID=A0AAI9SWZ2_9ASCO|nr:uncharacterized protein KGF56_002905 [Candida oxycetoniae]KAI3404266.1 hypothetical protein KGF56_002905 [Candida oxycetoniae]